MEPYDWTDLGDFAYRQLELYQMKWEKDVDLEFFHVAGAKFGGPIARLIKAGALIMGVPDINQVFRKYLTVHDSSGKLLGKMQWNFDKIFTGMGWTSDELLVVVYRSGEIDVLNVHCDKVAFPNPLFGFPPPKEKEIVDCEVYENMLIVLTRDNTFYHVRNIGSNSAFKPEQIAALGISKPPTCFKTIPAEHSFSGNLEILCGHPDGGIIFALETREVKRQTKIPFTHEDITRVEKIALSADGLFLALLLDNYKILVLQSNFSKSLGSLNTGSNKLPEQMAWCGSDALCVVYKNYVGIFGPQETTASIEVKKEKNGVLCIPEIDGLKFVTTEYCEFLEKVDPALQHSIGVGSFSPSSQLISVYEMYLENNTSSSESIRQLLSSEELNTAVETCVQAAASEFNVHYQEKLLKAASFGKSFLKPKAFDCNRLVETVKNLKVLNNLRREDIARPMTYRQFVHLRQNGELLIKRLLETNHHFLALQISKYCKLKLEPIYIHWACAKLIDQHYSDSEMCEMICSKLYSCKSVSYTEIARKALSVGRKELAIKLLDNEPATSRKVPLLLHMGEYRLALDRALESSDPDLIYLVIMRIHEEDKISRASPEYIPSENSRIEDVLNKPVAREMLLSYAKQLDESLLKLAFQYLRRPHDAGHFTVQKAFHFNDMKTRLRLLTNASDFYKSYDKDSLFAAATKEHLDLMGRQKILATTTGDRSLVDCSVCETICRLIQHDNEAEAEKFAKKFGVPEKKMWFLKLKVKASQGDWTSVEQMARVKKVPPIGWKPFAMMAVKKGQLDLAEQFILKVSDVDFQLTMLQYIGKWMKAAEVAMKAKNEDVLREIYQKCESAEVRDFIDGGVVKK